MKYYSFSKGIGVSVALIGIFAGLSYAMAQSTYSEVKPKGRDSAVKCTIKAVPDKAAGIPAFTYLLPEGWVDSSTYAWRTNQSGITASTIHLYAHTPDFKYQTHLYLQLEDQFSYTPNTNPIGVPLTKATDFGHHVLELLEKNGWSNFKVLLEKNQPLPESQMNKMQDQHASNGGMEQVYPLHEFGYLVVQGTSPKGVPSIVKLIGSVNGDYSSFGRGQVGSGLWTVSPFYQIVFPIDASSHGRAAVMTGIETFGLTPQEAAYDGLVVQENNKVMAHQFSFDEQMKWHAKQMKEFKAKMEGRDAIEHNFSNYILDKSDYEAPNGEILNLPNHEQAWRQGNSILYSDDPTFNPRNYKQEYLNWTPLKKIQKH